MNHIVCMVKDGDKYLADFICYHLEIIDRIWFIDHNSKNSIKRFASKKVKVFDYNFKAQFQGEAVTLVSRYIKNRYKNGFLFILDIDEFLPFKNHEEVDDFVDQFINKKVIGFNWINGFCFNKEKRNLTNLSEYDQIFFTSNINPNQKMAINLSKVTKEFAIGTGGHSVTDKKFFFRKIISPYLCGLTIYHILASSKDDLFFKIERYVDQMKYRLNVKGIGGWSVRQYLTNKNLDFLCLIAYYRTELIGIDIFGNDKFRLFDLDIFKNIKNTKEHNKYKEIGSKILLNKKIGKLTKEEEYIKFKENDNDIDKNIKWFVIDNYFVRILKPN